MHRMVTKGEKKVIPDFCIKFMGYLVSTSNL